MQRRLELLQVRLAWEQQQEKELQRVQVLQQELEQRLRRRNQLQRLLESSWHRASTGRQRSSKRRQRRYASCGFLVRQRRKPTQR